jgi:hypothetical protein
MSGGYGYQPYARKNQRRPSQALTNMRRGKPQYLPHPLDAQRELAKRSGGLRAALKRRKR